MNKKQLDEVMYCLSEDKQIYHYFKDKYCLFLFNHFIKNDITVKQLKNSHLGQFCQKPLVKAWMAKLGSQCIKPEMVGQLWSNELFHFTLTLGYWGGHDMYWQQTCRKGFNLVLQLNFTRTHDRQYQQMLDDELAHDPFIYYSHPVSKLRNTLAWARLDISEDFSEVLIEEIQTDWLRLAHSVYHRLKENRSPERMARYGMNERSWDQLQQYIDSVITPLLAIWDEAILCATLEYIVKQIGARHVYMYDHATGSLMKSIKQRHPPKSLYTQLPRKFGFKLTQRMPRFIENDRSIARKLKKIQKQHTPKWHVMNF